MLRCLIFSMLNKVLGRHLLPWCLAAACEVCTLCGWVAGVPFLVLGCEPADVLSCSPLRCCKLQLLLGLNEFEVAGVLNIWETVNCCGMLVQCRAP